LDSNLRVGGCCGKPCLDTEIRIVDPVSKATKFQDRPSLPIGEIGVVLGRGPQLMKVYYKNSQATSQAIDEYMVGLIPVISVGSILSPRIYS